MNRERFTLEIPASRKAFSDWYNADRNKRLIYYLALLAWILVILFMETILPLTATSAYRVAFYLPLVIFMLLLLACTHWLIQCALNDFAATQREHGQSVYVPENEDLSQVTVNNEGQ